MHKPQAPIPLEFADVAVVARVEGDKAYISGGLGYAYNFITTDRRVTFAGQTFNSFTNSGFTAAGGGV